VNFPSAGLILILLFPSAQDEVDRARRLIQDGKAAEAVDVLRPVTTPESKDGAAFLALADALRALRRYGEALAAYTRAGELLPKALEPVAGQAAMRSRLRQFPAAEERYRKVIAADPANLEARVGLAWILSLQRKLDDALKEIEAVLAIKPDHSDARIRLGWIRLWRHERAEAVKVFEAMIADHPGNVEAGLGLAAAELASGRVYVASGLVEALARLHPANADVLMAAARLRARRGRFEDARRAAQSAGELERDHLEALILLGEIAVREERFVEAEETYRRALVLEPEDVGARTGLATALRRQGRRDEARAVYRIVLEKDPDHVNARIGLGWEFVWEGAYGPAAAEFEQVLRRDPRHTDALAGLARVRHLQGRWSESQDLYERAIEIDPWDDAVLEGHTQIRRARESRARTAYVHAEEFERDQALELDTIRLSNDVFTQTWKKRLSSETAIDVELRMTLTREHNEVSDSDNYEIRHLAAIIGAHHRVADHWTIGGRLGAGRFDDRGSGGTWSFQSRETFLEGSAWAAGEWDGHSVSFSWSRSPLVIKEFPTTELDVLTLAGFSVRYESPWLKDGLTPEWHENRVEATLSRVAYSDDNTRWGVDATLRHRWLYDSGWRVGPLARFRHTTFDEDVPFYYAYDRQVRLTIGAQVEYEPPGAWSFHARYQATHTDTKERVNPGSHLFDPTQPIDLTSKTVTTDGHSLDAKATWRASETLTAGIDGVYTWDNDRYITWAIGVFLEVGF
jgi:tetratricopeptide (TPR) repeat protein